MLDRGSPNFEPSMPSRKMLRSAVLHHSTPLGAWADGTCRWPADSSPWTCCNRGWQSKLLRKHEGILCLVNRLGCKWIPLQKFHMNMFQNHMWTRVITCVNTCDCMCEHVWLHVITCDFGTCSCGIFVRVSLVNTHTLCDWLSTTLFSVCSN